ncbi:MAG: molybdenum cofactor guanylyltransferase [Sulfolobales archaeon]
MLREVCGIILSGGLSRRFQVSGESWVDKALYSINGKTMIERVYETLQELTDRIIISTRSLERVDSYKRVLRREVLYALDVAGLEGPFSGILSSLRACDREYAIITPVDMPHLSQDLLEKLLSKIDRYDVSSVVLPNGVIEFVLSAVRVGVVREILTLLAEYKRSRIADLYRGAPKTYFLNPAKHGFDPGVIANINRREDLRRRAKYPEGPVTDDVVLEREFSLRDVRERVYERLRESIWWTIESRDIYSELRLYMSRGLFMLAAYTLEDSENHFERYLGRIILEKLHEDLEFV